MRAIVLAKTGGPDVLTVSEIEEPIPGPGQVKVKVAYAAMNPLDVLVRAGKFRFHPPLPFVLGYQYGGLIAAVGEGVDAGKIGQRVSVSSHWGGYADYAVAPADAAMPIAPAFDWKQGTVTVGPALTAWHLLHTAARVREGDVIVVHAAAGAVGLMLTQIAKDAGAKVIGLVGGATKLAWAQQFGADLLLDYTADPDWPEKVKAFSRGAGATYIFDGNQGPDAPKNHQALAPMGQVFYIGAMAGPAPPVNVPALIGASHGVRGFVLPHAIASTTPKDLEHLVTMLSSGRWKFPIAPPVHLEQTADLHRMVEARTLLGRGIIILGGDL